MTRDDGVAREVPLEELLVERHVLDSHQLPPRFVLGNRVDEHRRVPVTQPVEQNGNVNHGDHC